jgi:hypothetical protein
LYNFRTRAQSVAATISASLKGTCKPSTEEARRVWIVEGERDGGEVGEVVLMARREVVVGETPKRRKESAIWWGS